MYSGCYSGHGLKYQIVISACGMLEDVAGPYSGKDHDATLANNCLLETRLRRFCTYTDDEDDDQYVDYMIYGDPAYAKSRFVHKPYQRKNATPFQQLHNTLMSKGRVAVENAIGEVTKVFSAMDFTRTERVGHGRVGMKYLVACMLRNVLTAIRGRNPISTYFGCPPPTLEQWLAPREYPPHRLVELDMY